MTEDTPSVSAQIARDIRLGVFPKKSEQTLQEEAVAETDASESAGSKPRAVFSDPSRLLAEELREYTALKYTGNCKCGRCQLVPRDLVDRLYAFLTRTNPPPVQPSDGVQPRIADGGQCNEQSGPKPREFEMAKRTNDVTELAKAYALQMSAEIDVWRRLYPRQVAYVTEQARAKLENRPPKELPQHKFG